MRVKSCNQKGSYNISHKKAGGCDPNNPPLLYLHPWFIFNEVFGHNSDYYVRISNVRKVRSVFEFRILALLVRTDRCETVTQKRKHEIEVSSITINHFHFYYPAVRDEQKHSRYYTFCELCDATQ